MLEVITAKRSYAYTPRSQIWPEYKLSNSFLSRKIEGTLLAGYRMRHVYRQTRLKHYLFKSSRGPLFQHHVNLVMFIRFLRISEFLERDLIIKITAKSDRRFDYSTVRTKFGVKDNLE